MGVYIYMYACVVYIYVYIYVCYIYIMYVHVCVCMYVCVLQATDNVSQNGGSYSSFSFLFRESKSQMQPSRWIRRVSFLYFLLTSSFLGFSLKVRFDLALENEARGNSLQYHKSTDKSLTQHSTIHENSSRSELSQKLPIIIH